MELGEEGRGGARKAGERRVKYFSPFATEPHRFSQEYRSLQRFFPWCFFLFSSFILAYKSLSDQAGRNVSSGSNGIFGFRRQLSSSMGRRRMEKDGGDAVLVST